MGLGSSIRVKPVCRGRDNSHTHVLHEQASSSVEIRAWRNARIIKSLTGLACLVLPGEQIIRGVEQICLALTSTSRTNKGQGT